MKVTLVFMTLIFMISLTGCLPKESPPRSITPEEPVEIYEDVEQQDDSGVIECENSIQLRSVKDDYTITTIYYIVDDVCSEYNFELLIHSGQSIDSFLQYKPNLANYDWKLKTGFYETSHIQLERELTREDVLRNCYISLGLMQNGGNNYDT